MVGRTLPFLSLVVPFYLVVLMAGFKKSMEVMPAILVSGVSFALFQWFTANYIGAMLPDVIAGLASIFSLMVFLRFWKPKSIWRFKEEPPQTIEDRLLYSPAQIFRAWSPFIIMTIIIIFWGLQPVKDALNSIGLIKIPMVGLEDQILKADGSVLAIKPFEFNYLSAPGSALLLATLLSLPLIGLSLSKGIQIYWETLKQLAFPMVTIGSVVGFAYVANNSGMLLSMAIALASTGVLFPFFSPILGWLGVFLTGSDTSSNALFGKLQAASAENIGLDPVLTVGANASGGVTGKMISPQSIAIGAAAVGLVGKESELFRFTVKHSFIMLFAISIITCIQAYVTPWVIPVYEKMSEATAGSISDVDTGINYLLILGGILVILFAGIKYFGSKSNSKA
jgi:lactate permease